MSTFRQLPFETISAIVNYIDNPYDLYHCTLINTAFYKRANPKLWHAPTKILKLSYYDFVGILLNGGQINNLRSLPLGHYIRRLDLKMVFDHKMKAAIVLLFANTPLLEIVTITNKYVPDRHRPFTLVPEYLPIVCPRLQEISVSGYTDDFLRNLGNCRQLRTLHLDAMFHDITYDGLASLRNCQLESLTLDAPYWNAIDSIHDLQQLTRLSTLIIMTNDDWNTELAEQLLFLSPQGSTNMAFPRLKKLCFGEHGGTGAETRTLVHILTAYSQLQDLTIDVANLDIVQGLVFPHLRFLKLTELRDPSAESVRSWINACPALTYFGYEMYSEDDEFYSYNISDIQRIRSGEPLEATHFLFNQN
ncbi:hypothetical protein [Absidia glauca]|uniref:F-box domain-containing protein n=1 Tax=Absidia glauca TaxID=4829 RepID=A0A168QE75_ABSGL|nr:hypothetical protein [Absidia glauca]